MDHNSFGVMAKKTVGGGAVDPPLPSLNRVKLKINFTLQFELLIFSSHNDDIQRYYCDLFRQRFSWKGKGGGIKSGKIK